MGKKGFEGDEGIRELGIPAAEAPLTVTVPYTITVPFEPEETFENVLPEVEVIYVEPSILLNMQKTSSENKRKHNEMSLTGQENKKENEHDYCLEAKMASKKGKRIKRKNIPRISKNIEDMTSESVIILRSIERNTSRIADTFERVANILLMQQQQHHEPVLE